MKGTYVIVRTLSAGAFAGTLLTDPGTEVRLQNARRLWYWDGAASLSQLAISGTSKPHNCKFPAAVSEVFLPGVIEVISASAGKESIENVPTWKE